MDYSIGDVVVYGGNGVCEIEDIKDISFYHEEPQTYYILKPMFVKQALVLYVPFNNEKLTSKIQPVITRDEAMDLIHGINDTDIEWIEDRNLRKETYSTMISSGDRREIVEVISIISDHRRSLLKEGKSLNMQDEKMLNDAQRRMNAEFAVALDIEIEEVPGFINGELAKVG